MNPKLHLIAVLAVWAAASHAETPSARAFDAEAVKQSAIYQSRGESVPEGYVIGRSLLSYSYILSSDFKSALGSLGPEDRWLDIGAGEGRAVLDYCTSRYDAILPGPKPAKKAKAVALSIEDRRTPQWHQTVASLESDQVKYLFGRRLREYSKEELGEFDVITDVLGAFSYTRHLSTFMETALGLLDVNGSLHTVLQDVQGEDGTNRPYYPDARFLTEIAKPDGSQMKVCSWLKSIGCAEVTCELKPEMSPPIEVYRVRKVCNDVRVPALVMTHFEAGTPPERKFQLRSATQ